MDLEFGTAGLRGVIGAGTNRMNIYTVRQSDTGTGELLSAKWEHRQKVLPSRMIPDICPRSSPTRRRFVLHANGIKAYVFESLRPTPELSFAVRELGCISGINITASHNPPEYNGYKVYWEDGAQITPPHDTGIMDEVRNVTDYASVKTMPLEEANAADGLYQTIGADIDDPYIAELKNWCFIRTALTKLQS